MKPTIKTLLFGGVAALALLFAAPAASQARPWAVQPWHSYGYHVRPYGAYYGWGGYPSYYYQAPAYPYGYGYGYGRRFRDYDDYGYRPWGGVQVGPFGVWW